MAKKKINKKMKGPKNPWFRRRYGNIWSNWGFIPINWIGYVTLILLVGINVFAAQYFNLNVLVLNSYLKFGVVFLLSIFVFIMIAKKKTAGVQNDK